jgi:hypothetical protein
MGVLAVPRSIGFDKSRQNHIALKLFNFNKMRFCIPDVLMPRDNSPTLFHRPKSETTLGQRIPQLSPRKKDSSGF